MTEEIVELVEDDADVELGYDPDEIARQVLAGHWGRGNRRNDRLRAAGYDPNLIATCVKNILRPTT